MKTEKYVCPKCKKPVHVQIDPTSGGVISSPDYDLIADWVFHSQCWADQLEAGMGGQHTHAEKLKARIDDERERTEAVMSLARVFNGMTHEAMITCLAAYVVTQARDGEELSQLAGLLGMGIGALVHEASPGAFTIVPVDGRKI